MWGMYFHGSIIWSEGIVAASIIIALVASVAAFWILFRLLSLFPHLEYLRFASAFVMAVAVTGMHFVGESCVLKHFVNCLMMFLIYVGMAAGKWDYSEGHYTPPPHLESMGTVSSGEAFYGALLVSVGVVCILMALTLADLRAWLYETATQLDRAEALLYKIDDHCYSVAIHHYRERKRTRYQIKPEGATDKPRGCCGGRNRYLAGSSASISPFDQDDEVDEERSMYKYMKGLSLPTISTSVTNSNSSIFHSNKRGGPGSPHVQHPSASVMTGTTATAGTMSPPLRPALVKQGTGNSMSLSGAINQYRAMSPSGASPQGGGEMMVEEL